MLANVHASQVYGLAVDWLRSNILIADNAVQLAALAGVLGLFLVFVRSLRRFFVDQASRFSGGVRSLLVPAAATAPWLVLLLALWFTTLLFAEQQRGVAILRLAESLTLVWCIIKLSSGLVRSERLARTIAAAAFIIAALNIAGLLGAVVHLLDSMAIEVGPLRLSVLLLAKEALALAVFLWLATMLARVVETRLGRLTELSPAMQVLTSKLVRFALITLAIVLSLGAVGIDLTAFAVFSGAVGVGIGLGLQKVVSNLVSGVILLIDRSIKPGDVIEMDGSYGWITSLNARYVSVATRDGKEILVPNEDLITGRVTNWSFSSDLIRQHVLIGISYDSDLHFAKRLAVEAAADVARTLDAPKPACLLKEFGDSSVNLELRFWIKDPTNGTANVRSDVMQRVWDLFREHGVEFSSPQRELTLRHPWRVFAGLATEPERLENTGQQCRRGRWRFDRVRRWARRPGHTRVDNHRRHHPCAPLNPRRRHRNRRLGARRLTGL
jgi:small-conductance mechanosensitive channel